jgi:hypothetical protein
LCHPALDGVGKLAGLLAYRVEFFEEFREFQRGETGYTGNVG